MGVCGTASCYDMTAVDTTGEQACGIACTNANESSCSCQGTTLVTAFGADGVERSVSLADRRRLSLGRALLARTDWLGAAADGPAGPWNLTARLDFFSLWSTDGGPHPTVPALSRMAATLRGVPGRKDPDLASAGGVMLLDNTSTVWPQQLASVLCMPPATSFLRRPDRVCTGFGPSTYDRPYQARAPTVAGQSTAVADLPMFRGYVQWVISPNIFGRAAAGDVPLVRNATPATWTASPFPPASSGPSAERLAVYGTREVNKDSATERSLAASIRRRLVYLPTRAGDVTTLREPFNRLVLGRLEQSAEKVLERMSVAHDASAFGVDSPPPPASSQDIGLAILVVLPEAVAIAAATVGTRSWRRREAATLGLLFVSGLVSLSAIISLLLRERAGANWRAATTRTAVGARFPIGIDNRRFADVDTVLTGTEVVLLETFVVVARLGYRPRRLAAITAAISAAYIACSAVAAVVVYRSVRSARAAEAAAAAAATATAAADGGEVMGLVGGSHPTNGGDGDAEADAAAPPGWKGHWAALEADIAQRLRVAK